jgi:hypothetical protein
MKAAGDGAWLCPVDDMHAHITSSSVAGHVVPQVVTCWMGTTPSSSCSRHWPPVLTGMQLDTLLQLLRSAAPACIVCMTLVG